MRGKINKLLIPCLILGLNIQASEVITAKATILGNEESVGFKDDRTIVIPIENESTFEPFKECSFVEKFQFYLCDNGGFFFLTEIHSIKYPDEKKGRLSNVAFAAYDLFEHTKDINDSNADICTSRHFAYGGSYQTDLKNYLLKHKIDIKSKNYFLYERSTGKGFFYSTKIGKGFQEVSEKRYVKYTFNQKIKYSKRIPLEFIDPVRVPRGIEEWKMFNDAYGVKNDREGYFKYLLKRDRPKYEYGTTKKIK